MIPIRRELTVSGGDMREHRKGNSGRESAYNHWVASLGRTAWEGFLEEVALS